MATTTTHDRRLRRDGLTWSAYALLAWFAYLQAAPGLVVPYLRREVDMGFAVAGLHVSGFAAGCAAAGLLSARAERRLGRARLVTTAAVVMAAGALVLISGRSPWLTASAVVVMGVGGGTLLAVLQAALEEHHRPLGAAALGEANLAAGLAYLGLTGALSLAAWLHAGWRAALVASLVVPALTLWRTRGLRTAAPRPTSAAGGERLPRRFWVAVGVLVCGTAAEWCITGWGASFMTETAGVSTDVAVQLMAGYFGGMVLGRAAGSRVARRLEPGTILGLALATSAAGFAVLWTSGGPAQALAGIALLGVGLGNLYPMGTAVAMGTSPDAAAGASGRVVTATALGGLAAPFTVGALADATSLRAALLAVPALLALAGVGLLVVRADRAPRPSPGTAV